MENNVEIRDKWECPAGTGAPLITMPNVPRPLHGLAPRKIMGDSTWDHVRKRCYYLAGYKCEVCGEGLVKPYYAAHELYSYDYIEGIGQFERYIAICSKDHDFIHSGRMVTLFKSGNTFYPKSYVLEVVEKGFKLINEYNSEHCKQEPLKAYATFLNYLKTPELTNEIQSLIDKYNIEFYQEPKHIAKWNKWRLIIGNKEYPSPYSDQGKWVEAMKEASQNDTIRVVGNPDST